jgi:hypothetical protein
LSHFVKIYRDEDAGGDAQEETNGLKRSMLLSLLSTLYQNSLITPQCVVQSLNEFDEKSINK